MINQSLQQNGAIKRLNNGKCTNKDSKLAVNINALASLLAFHRKRINLGQIAINGQQSDTSPRRFCLRINPYS